MKKLFILLCFILPVFVNAGQVFYVSKSGNDANNGMSWVTAFADVQTAIDAAAVVATGEAPAEVWIAAGTYKHGSAMTMKNNVGIYGGFAGIETDKSQRVAGQNKTYLDGNSSYSVFYNEYDSSNNLTSSAKLDNVVIQNGKTSRFGGGMYNKYASPMLTNCTFSRNVSYGGGGLYNNHASPTLINCTFSNNTSYVSGGGVCNDNYTSPTLTNCTFRGNTASNGGGVYNTGSSCFSRLINCTFRGNTAETDYGRGGGMYNPDSNPTIINCIFWGNTAEYGHEIYNGSTATATLDNCIVQGGYSGSGTYTNIITADPKLGTLGDYGGNVQTIPVLKGSSAIGAGKVVEGVETDARGFARSASAPTIGAYEYTLKDATKNGVAITTTSGYTRYVTNQEFTLNVDVPYDATLLTYQWYKNGEEIDGATEVTFKTKQTEANAVYTVKVSDGTTTITSEPLSIEALPARYYVTTNGSSSNDGLTWETAKNDVQDAIDAAAAVATDEAPAEVWIAAGIYKHGSAMKMKNNVGIYGGFAGTETTKEERVKGQNKTYLEGENKYTVFSNKYTNYKPLKGAIIENITIRYGNTGMFNYCASMTIIDCTFQNNILTNGYFDGGRVYYGGGAIIVDGEGGANYCTIITNSTFNSNSLNIYTTSHTVTSPTGNGGAILFCSGGGRMIITNCTFVANRAANKGSAICAGGIIDIRNCTFVKNHLNANNNNDQSVIYCGFNVDDERYNIINCIFNQNTCVENQTTRVAVYVARGTSGQLNMYSCCDSVVGELGDYGGNVQTIPVLAGSSAIGAGKVVEDVETDARGFARSTAAPTIGAYEYVYGNPPYEKWVLDNNIPQNQSEPSATPRGDGIPNIEKFVFGLDASKPASFADNPYFSQTSDGSSLNLSFPVSVDAEGAASVKAMKSTDLVNWTEVSATQTRTSQDGKFNLYKASAEIPAGGKIFIKLNVEE